MRFMKFVEINRIIARYLQIVVFKIYFIDVDSIYFVNAFSSNVCGNAQFSVE